MSDEDIIKLWKQGWSIERIARKFPSRLNGKKAPSWQMINRVETVVLNWQKGDKKDEIL